MALGSLPSAVPSSLYTFWILFWTSFRVSLETHAQLLHINRNCTLPRKLGKFGITLNQNSNPSAGKWEEQNYSTDKPEFSFLFFLIPVWIITREMAAKWPKGFPEWRIIQQWVYCVINNSKLIAEKLFLRYLKPHFLISLLNQLSCKISMGYCEWYSLYTDLLSSCPVAYNVFT